MKHILLIHGAFEHPGRYSHVESFLKEGDYTLTLPTLRCHGARPEPVVHITDFREYVEDVISALKTPPDWVIGHSMGGLVALHAVQMGLLQPERLILLSPFLATSRPVLAWQIKLAGILDRIVPGLTLPTGIRSAQLSRDTQVVEAHKQDKLIRKRLTVSWFRAILAAQESALEGIDRVSCPVAIFSAGTDAVVSLDKQKLLAHMLREQGKLMQHTIYPQAYHELLNEPERWDILRDILNAGSSSENS